MKKRHLMCGAAAAAALTGLAGPAAAQGDAARDEIIVSARKTEESLQEAPIAVTAMTAQDLAERSIRNIDDVARFVPGLSFSQAFGRSTDRPVIRGQSNVLANVQFGVEAGAAYFVDGIYYPSSIQTLDFNLIRQVEVIRGPQSALYGRNTYSGAINFITQDAPQDFTARMRGRVANGGESMLGGSLGGQLIPGVLGMMVSASYYEYNGQHTNEITGKKVGSEETWNITGLFNFNPSDAFKAKLRIGYQQDNDGPIPLFLKGSADNNCLPGFRSNRYRAGGTLNATPGGQNRNQYFCGVIAPQPVRLNTSTGLKGELDGTAFDGIEREMLIAGLVMDWAISDSVTITSQTGFRNENEKFGADSDHSDANIFTGSPLTTESFFANTSRDDIRDWSQEIRLEYRPTDRFRFLVGGFYYDYENKGTDITRQSGEAGVPHAANAIAAGCVGATVTCSDTSTTKNWAVFGLAEFGITDTLSITGEVRYMEEQKTFIQYGQTGNIRFPLAGVSGETDEDYVTPRVTLDWQASPDLLLYAVYAQGVKPGGLNGIDGQGVGRPQYLPEKADSYEIGAKATMFDGKLTANLSGYYIESSDVQLTTAIPATTAVNSIVTNQGQGEILGLEAEFVLRPNDSWEFTANYAWTRPEFTSGCDQDEWILTSGGGNFFGPGDPRNASFNGIFGGTASCDISGRRYPLSSEHMASGSASYSRPVSNNMEGFFSVNATYESSKFVQVHNLAETGDAFILGAQMGVRGEGWSVNVFGRNLTDEDSITAATRWFDFRYGLGPNVGAILGDGGAVTPAPGANGANTSFPRGLFGSLRRPMQVGVEFSVEF